MKKNRTNKLIKNAFENNLNEQLIFSCNLKFLFSVCLRYLLDLIVCMNIESESNQLN